MRNGHLSRVAALPFCLLLLWLMGTGMGAAAGSDQPLRKGDRSSSVKTIQQQLLSLGYDVGVPDGDFGTKTEEAVRDFQRSVGLPVDGVVGAATRQALADAVTTYMVRAGDTLYQIARSSGITVEQLQLVNGLNNHLIVTGQQLLIPKSVTGVVAQSPRGNGKSSEAVTGTSGQSTGKAVASEDPPADSGASGATAGGDPVTSYQVKPGDTLTSIANQFGTTVAALIRVNPLSDPDVLQVGQEIRLPMEVAARGGQIFPGSLLWPVRGPISSGYGSRIHPLTGGPDFHEGIDISVNVGTPVRAAAAGIVEIAGDMGGYGLGVVIRHPGGVETLYGHNSDLLVRVGQYVSRGQVIAYSGNTGMSTGPHVDFRVKKDGVYQNPLDWLP